ncbi:MAG: hypothetical protein FWE47_03655 [Oscillospiraceae bacterium]|nr:hypothetical protein [Oscillospiraceae bacterium]
MKFFKFLIEPRVLAIALFTIYLIIGLFTFNDYGMSYDQSVDRGTALVNYVHVMKNFMLESDNRNIREVAEKASELGTYFDRFYGSFLQTAPIAIEHLYKFELSTRETFLIRYLFVFLNFWLGGIFFYLILKKRFTNPFVPLIGALIYILYPRFFAEAFYNNKDVLFFSWVMIASYFVLCWLDGKKKWAYVFPAALALAIATNTRILGMALLLLACLFSVVQDIRHKRFLQMILWPLVLAGLTFIFYIIITPFVWAHPISNTIETFRHFLQFKPWNNTHLYLGDMISRDVPWHYLFVWMGATIPISYILLFLIGVFVTGWEIIKRKVHIYDLFFLVFIVCTFAGYIGLNISMYEGWRHAYILFCPFLFIAVLAVDRLMLLRFSRLWAPWVMVLCLGYLAIWNIANHPYQYVYFNSIARPFAEKNFCLDYWEVSHYDLVQYILENDERDEIKVDIYKGQHLMLNDADKKRIKRINDNLQGVDYFIQNTRMAPNRRTAPEGFEEVHAIVVDGIKISRLYKKIEI